VLKFANVAIPALDVSIRAQMMNLLKQIQTQDKVAYLLVAHDLATVRHMTDQTIIRYLGKIVELAPTRVLFDEVRHTYTKALFSAVLLARSAQLAEKMVLAEELPSPLNPPGGCRFDTRCPMAMPRCSKVEPPLREVSPGHRVACHSYEATDESLLLGGDKVSKT
jgi:oligopeptide/dipeptide ABC transporter ATP-binding protein